ncbi:MAG: ABC transporter ATP-binding protein [Trueperaceae bacterium]|nr:ABC transporter ATP-binding protein [Trueperaceae bacterium]
MPEGSAERPHVEIRDVSKTFGHVVAVDRLSLDVATGSFTTLLGPSGCGKTTTLRMLAGFYDPDAGDILIGGVPQQGIPPNRRNVSIVFQDYALFPHMTVLQNVSYGLKFRRLDKAERDRRVSRVLEFLGLDALEARHPHELSGGQQQRVALGRSIVMEPHVLLMDEPLSNLDAKLRIRVRAELKEIQRATGITTIYVTHDQDEALSLSDRVAVMADGRLQQYSEPWELYHAPANRFVADFVGYANVIPGRVLERGAGTATVLVPGSNTPLRCLDPASRAAAGADVGVMVRPEWFTLSPADEKAAITDGVVLIGEVRSGSFLGAFVRAFLEVPGIGDPLVVESTVTRQDQMASGTRLRLCLPHDRAVLVD